jgi:transcriptional regulator with XRE-family HTH domain
MTVFTTNSKRTTAPTTEEGRSDRQVPTEHQLPSDELRRQELGAFLRSRRERISPRELGLPPGGRRRTPGLRREEVAQLAGVGVTWFTWLEQGRDIKVSEQVLDAIAPTLLFDPHERDHLFTLAGAAEPIMQRECQSLPQTMQVVLNRFEPFPACVLNARFDILAFNATYGSLIEDLTAMAFSERNTLWLAFTHTAWRRAIVEWEDAVARMVAMYRAAMAEHMAEPAWKAFVRRLSEASPEFREVWKRHEVRSAENYTKLIMHPTLGLLRLDTANFWLGPRVGTRMITYTPADDDTRVRLEKFAADQVSVRAPQ